MRNYAINEYGYVQYEEEGVIYTIPADPANSDYQAYLASLGEQQKAAELGGTL